MGRSKADQEEAQAVSRGKAQASRRGKAGHVRRAGGGPGPLPAGNAGPDPDEPSLGHRLRRLRKQQSLGLEQLARASGLSASLISRIERDMTSPSIRSLRALCAGLNVSVGSLFEDAQAGDERERGVVLRRGDRRLLNMGMEGLYKEILTPEPPGAQKMFLVTVSPGGRSSEEFYTHPGEEAGVVLSGELDLWLGKDRLFRLREGDSFRFASTTPHRFENNGLVEACIIWVNTPPIY